MSVSILHVQFDVFLPFSQSTIDLFAQAGNIKTGGRMCSKRRLQISEMTRIIQVYRGEFHCVG